MIVLFNITTKKGAIYTTKLDAANSISSSLFKIRQAIKRNSLINDEWMCFEADLNKNRSKKGFDFSKFNVSSL